MCAFFSQPVFSGIKSRQGKGWSHTGLSLPWDALHGWSWAWILSLGPRHNPWAAWDQSLVLFPCRAHLLFASQAFSSPLSVFSCSTSGKLHLPENTPTITPSQLNSHVQYTKHSVLPEPHRHLSRGPRKATIRSFDFKSIGLFWYIIDIWYIIDTKNICNMNRQMIWCTFQSLLRMSFLFFIHFSLCYLILYEAWHGTSDFKMIFCAPTII